MKSLARDRRRITSLGVCAGLLVMATVSVLWPWPFVPSSNTAAAQGTVNVGLDPSSQTVDPGVTFDVAIRIDAGTQGVAAADVFLNFNPAYLSVVEIVDGTALTILAKIPNPAAGTIDIGAGTLGSPVTGSFVLATLRLQGKVGTGSTPTELAFSFTPPRVTVVKNESDQNVLGGYSNGYIYITGPTPTGPPATPTSTATPTRTATPTQSATPTVTPTPQGTPETKWFQNGVHPNPSYSGTQDTYLDAWTPDANRGAEAELQVRTDAAKRALIKFDLPPDIIPPGSTVVEAKLYLYLFYRKESDYPDADLYTVNRHWEELTTSWNNPWQLAGCDAIPGDRGATPVATQRLRYLNTTHEWDITNLVQEWVSGLTPNEGVLMKDIRGTIVNEIKFRSSNSANIGQRPALMVRFYRKPSTPTPTRTATPTQTATATNTPTSTPTNTPTPVPGGINGQVWNDLDGDGVKDAGEPGLAGATIRLYDYAHPAPEPPIRPAIPTGADGVFDFAELSPARYILVVTNPAGYVPTTPETLTVLVSSGATSQTSFGAWIPATATPTASVTASPTLTVAPTGSPTASLTPTSTRTPTATIYRPYKLFIPIIRRG